MARRTSNQTDGTESTDTQPTQDGIPGGAAGIIPDASSTIATGASSSRAELSSSDEAKPTKRYRVTNDAPAGKTGFPVLLDGCLTHLPKGKIVLDSAYDVEKLRDQGVTLDEV